MRQLSYAVIAIIFAAFVLVVTGTVFTVSQTQQVLLLRFGEPVPGRTLITDAGLHFKVPFVETAVFLDKRILDVETPKQEVLASDNNRIEVDAFLRYRIVDPLKFYQSVGSMAGADQQLSNIMNSAVRRVLGEASMPDIVREKRAQLMAQIRTQVDVEAGKFGLQIKDVRIRRADLPRQISEKVFSRMQTERAREAAEFRAQGSEQAQRITAKADRDVIVLRAQAQQQAEQIRGQGDGERNRIFAEAYGKDPDFFAFYRSMQAYETGLKAGETRLVLSPNSEFFRYFLKSQPSTAGK
jgi:modulator of FtsH protease HflC